VNRQILALAADLEARGEPFVLATVVWRRSPSSGQEGGTALVRPTGDISGWIGGACAEPTVIRESLRALGDGVPRLLFMGLPGELAAHRRDGVVSVPIACQSEGALEVYVDPVLPQPHLVIVGRSPAVDTLAGLARTLGWDTVVVDDGGSGDGHPSAGRVVTSLDLGAAGVSDRSFLVVATQGHYDEEALQRALATPARYVALVASRRRADGVREYLREHGVSDDDLARVRAPAGLDLGAVAHEEIAVAVLAEMVKEKAAAQRRLPTAQAAEGAVAANGETPREAEAAPEPLRHEAVDPVCGMTIDIATARDRAVHDGRTHYFCGVRCKERFEAEPLRWVEAG
jgi:xanthine dehydrogenase accessory factor